MKTVSIICPVYNAEAYLRRCVDSVLAQTLTDWELILVDDGSPDGSGIICDEYAAKDSRIRVIHQPNGGVAQARQAGLDAARGVYVIHVDPDDWIEADMLSVLYDTAQAVDADMVFCDYFEDSALTSKVVSQNPSSTDAHVVFQELFHDIHGFCWNKLVRRELFSRYDVRFPSGYVILEDLFVSASLCRHDIKIAHVPRPLYHYVQDVNPNSLVRRPTRATVESIMRFCTAFHPLWEERGLLAEEVSYMAHARSFAYESRLYDRNELRRIFAEHNGAILRRALRNYREAPWDVETWLGQYLPRCVAHLFTAVVCRMRKMFRWQNRK